MFGNPSVAADASLRVRGERKSADAATNAFPATLVFWALAHISGWAVDGLKVSAGWKAEIPA